MADIINVQSPLGYTVVCSQNTWNNHIVINHPIMSNNQNAVINTITDPDEIYLSNETGNNDEERHVYYSKTSGAEYNNNGFMTRVIVELPNPNISVGDIVTAFPSKTKGGSVINDNKLYERAHKN